MISNAPPDARGKLGNLIQCMKSTNSLKSRREFLKFTSE